VINSNKGLISHCLATIHLLQTTDRRQTTQHAIDALQQRCADADTSANWTRICKHSADAVADAILDVFENVDADATLRTRSQIWTQNLRIRTLLYSIAVTHQKLSNDAAMDDNNLY